MKSWQPSSPSLEQDELADPETLEMATISTLLEGQGEQAATFGLHDRLEELKKFYQAIKDAIPIVRELLINANYLSNADRGFDLYVTEDGVNFETITTDGFGDPFNHGLRVYAETDAGLCIGTANPFYGTQIWLMEDEAEVVEDVPEIVSVTVAPKTASVKKGNQQQFTANVETKGDISTAVLWSVVGQISENTVISADGKLTVGEDETAETLTVQAVSAVAADKFDTATVTVTEETEEDVPEIVSVTVAPKTASVKKGDQQQFIANVETKGDISTAVLWSVVGQTSENTVISADGKLTVGEDETAETLTVQAVSAAAADKFDTATVTVSEKDIPVPVTYTVQVESGAGDGMYRAGDVVTIEADVRTGYTFQEWTSDDAALLENKSARKTSFIMPEHDVMLQATYQKNSSGSSDSGFSGVYNYKVDVDTDSIKDAKVTLSKEHAVAGETVTITITVAPGKAVDKVIVRDESGRVLSVSKVEKNKFSFVMPEGQIKIEVLTKNAEPPKQIIMQIDKKDMMVNDSVMKNDVSPVIIGNQTMVPIRVITEALGGSVIWDGATKNITLTLNDQALSMTIGKTADGMDVAPIILNDRTYVPVRYVAEKLGADVSWDAATKQITIQLQE